MILSKPSKAADMSGAERLGVHVELTLAPRAIRSLTAASLPLRTAHSSRLPLLPDDGRGASNSASGRAAMEDSSCLGLVRPLPLLACRSRIKQAMAA